MRDAFRSVRQARKADVFAPLTMVAVIPQVFCGKCTATYVSANHRDCYLKIA